MKEYGLSLKEEMMNLHDKEEVTEGIALLSEKDIKELYHRLSGSATLNIKGMIEVKEKMNRYNCLTVYPLSSTDFDEFHDYFGFDDGQPVTIKDVFDIFKNVDESTMILHDSIISFTTM